MDIIKKIDLLTEAIYRSKDYGIKLKEETEIKEQSLVHKWGGMVMKPSPRGAIEKAMTKLWLKKKGKEDDIDPKTVEKTLKDNKIPITDKNFKEAKAFLVKKGFKVWAKAKLRGFGKR